MPGFYSVCHFAWERDETLLAARALMMRCVSPDLSERKGYIPDMRTNQSKSSNQGDGWKRWFYAPAYWEPKLAKEKPGQGLVVSNQSGINELYAWDLMTGHLTPLMEAPTGMYLLSPDGRYLFFLRDEAGNDYGHYMRFPVEGGELEDLTPDMPPYAAFAIFCSQDGQILGFTQADQSGFHTHCIGLQTNGDLDRRWMLYESQALTAGPWLSYDGKVALLASNKFTGTPHFGLVALDVTDKTTLNELWDGAETDLRPRMLWPFSPFPGDYRILTQTNRTGFQRPVIWDPITNERLDLEFSQLEGDVYPLDWSPDGQKLLLRQFHQAVQQHYVYNLPNHTLRRLAHPPGVYGSMYFGPTDEIVAQWEDAGHPSQIIVLEPATGIKHQSLLAGDEVPPGQTWQSVFFSSSDGQTIQAWLATPDHRGPFPTIIELHGGPLTVQVARFHPESQVWLAHGFAFMTINYRGSTTFGQDFQNQIIGDVGHWELADIVAARAWLIEQGVADPERLLLTGWSYGGYLTLLSLGKYPTFWAGGIAGAPIIDWQAVYEDTTAAARSLVLAMLGGTPQEKPDLYHNRSPINYVNQIKVPILILHGRNDTHSTTRQIEHFEWEMQRLGKQVDVVWYDGGHDQPANQVEHRLIYQERMLQFAQRILSKE